VTISPIGCVVETIQSPSLAKADLKSRWLFMSTP
jgi:hypothetical protein